MQQSLVKPAPSARFVPAESGSADGDDERYDGWGFADSAFRVTAAGQVEMTGRRYALCGSELPYLLAWMRSVLGIDFAADDVHPSVYPPDVPHPRRSAPFLDSACRILGAGAMSDEPLARLRHGHGHTQEEIYALRHGRLARVPDLVVWPSTEEQVEALLTAASACGVCLIPFGGGTNVTDALRCPDDEPRPIVSVDMRRMNRIRWIDPVNRNACIEAGAVGRHLAEALARHGFTLGHEPDSVEFSTLGGWIATRASGMKKNRYGNIEDIVLDVSVVTPQGRLERRLAPPRESIGIDPRAWIFGSEGGLGIVTSAVVRVFPLPEVQRYGSIVFPSFEDGFAFLYALSSEGSLPASVRLVDNLQFQFSMALKPAVAGWRAARRRLERWYVTGLRGMDPQRMVACTLVFEGGRGEVAAQEKTAYRLAARHGGIEAGADNGQRGYQLTFGIAYIRDFAMSHWILGESFETSAGWGDALALCANVKRRLSEEHAARKLPGTPFVTCRVTQLYPTGVCIYFYFAYYYKGVDRPSEVYAEMERAARDEILKSGGSLSHHHGIGKLRQEFLPRVLSPAALDWLRAAKRALDPDDVFGCANQLLSGERTRVPGRP
jgi:alkyldihydroxyacetonephosphate synthase